MINSQLKKIFYIILIWIVLYFIVVLLISFFSMTTNPFTALVFLTMVCCEISWASSYINKKIKTRSKIQYVINEFLKLKLVREETIIFV